MTKEDRAQFAEFAKTQNDLVTEVRLMAREINGNGSGVGLNQRMKTVEDWISSERQERLKRQLEFDERREKERKEREEHRRNTRRWIVGTIISAAGILVAVVAL